MVAIGVTFIPYFDTIAMVPPLNSLHVSPIPGHRMCRVPAIAHGRVLTVHSLSPSALRVGAGPPARLEALMSRPQLAIRVVLIRYEPLGLITSPPC